MAEINLSVMKAEVEHIREKVDSIDSKLETMQLGSRLAVLEDRQNSIYKMVHAVTAIFSTVISGIILWLFTR